MALDAHALVVSALGRLERALAERDVDAAVACFGPQGAVFGTALTEDAHGAAELRRLFASFVERDLSFAWHLDESYVVAEDDELCFVADAVLVITTLRRETRRRLRLTGTLRAREDHYRLELFSGFEPVLRPALGVVG